MASPLVPSRPRREPHRMGGRQSVADFQPMVALVLGHVKAAGGRGEGEPVAAVVYRHRMAIDEVVGMALRQAFTQDVERLAAVARAGDDQLALDRNAPFILDRRDEPCGVGIARVRRDRKAER